MGYELQAPLYGEEYFFSLKLFFFNYKLFFYSFVQ